MTLCLVGVPQIRHSGRLRKHHHSQRNIVPRLPMSREWETAISYPWFSILKTTPGIYHAQQSTVLMHPSRLVRLQSRRQVLSDTARQTLVYLRRPVLLNPRSNALFIYEHRLSRTHKAKSKTSSKPKPAPRSRKHPSSKLKALLAEQAAETTTKR